MLDRRPQNRDDVGDAATAGRDGHRFAGADRFTKPQLYEFPLDGSGDVGKRRTVERLSKAEQAGKHRESEVREGLVQGCGHRALMASTV